MRSSGPHTVWNDGARVGPEPVKPTRTGQNLDRSSLCSGGLDQAIVPRGIWVTDHTGVLSTGAGATLMLMI